MREFEKELVRNMTESELESMCKTISTLTGLIKINLVKRNIYVSG